MLEGEGGGENDEAADGCVPGLSWVSSLADALGKPRSRASCLRRSESSRLIDGLLDLAGEVLAKRREIFHCAQCDELACDIPHGRAFQRERHDRQTRSVSRGLTKQPVLRASTHDENSFERPARQSLEGAHGFGVTAAEHFLSKPFTPSDLAHKVREVLSWGQTP